MAWYKSGLRAKMSGRYLRWSALRALVRLAPSLKKPLSFLGAGVPLGDAAQALLWTDEITIEQPFSAEQEAFIAERCQKNDGADGPGYWRAPWGFRDEHFLLREVWALGHTGRLVDRDYTGVITGWGAAENWNRDKIASLRDGAPLSGVAVPVRSLTNYFHMIVETALPIVAYFESGAAPARKHTLLAVQNDRPFVIETLKAIAARYGADLRIMKPTERVLCEEAVAMRRSAPCSDWYPARPESAAALRAALAAHLGAEIGGPRLPGLYLQRGREKLRNLENEPALAALAAERGFTTLRPSGENFDQQIALAARADLVLGVHGAAFANLLFAEPGTRVVEIFGRGGCKSVYMALSRQLGLNHRFCLGGEDDFRQNFSADLSAVAAALDPA